MNNRIGHTLAGATLLATSAAGLAASAMEYTPQPEVSSVGSEALIELNDLSREYGTEAFLGFLAASAAIYGGAKLSPRRAEMLKSTESSLNKSNALARVLPPFLIASVAVATGLGSEAGDGANESNRVMAEIMGNDTSDIQVIVQHENVLPFNHSTLAKDDAAKVESWVTENGGTSLVFKQALGDANNPELETNPSSAAITAIPAESMESLGLDSKDIRKPGIQAVVSSQFAESGDSVLIEGKDAEVIEALDVYPGLDRTFAFASIEDTMDSIFKGEQYSGVLVAGLEDNVDLNKMLADMGIDAASIPMDQWIDNYNQFWDRSVKPPEMQFVLMIIGAGLIGSSYIRYADVLQRKKQLAVQNIMGVPKRTMKTAEYMRSVVTTSKASLTATPLIVGLTAVTNSSQYGLNMPTTLAGLGAGTLFYGMASLGSTMAANGIIDKMDSATEVRK